MKRSLTVIAAALAAILLSALAATGNPEPPTNGGTGAGHSGQCTGPADDRPAVCPGT